MKNKDTKYRIAGLFRCCAQSIEELNPEANAKPFKCRFCKDRIAFKDGVYYWKG